MRIDLHSGPQPAPEAGRSTQNAPAANAAASPGLGEDQAQLSGAHAQIQALAAQAASLPEVRRERVEALRQAVEAGHYRPSPENTARAIVAHMMEGSAA